MPGKAAHERKKRLSKGRSLRQRRASALRELRQGHITIKDVLHDPQELSGKSVHTVLKSAPKLGDTSATKLCKKLDIWPLANLGDISPEKRAALYDALPERAKNFS